MEVSEDVGAEDHVVRHGGAQDDGDFITHGVNGAIGRLNKLEELGLGIRPTGQPKQQKDGKAIGTREGEGLRGRCCGTHEPRDHCWDASWVHNLEIPPLTCQVKPYLAEFTDASNVAKNVPYGTKLATVNARLAMTNSVFRPEQNS
jgi:hypothetical protein